MISHCMRRRLALMVVLVVSPLSASFAQSTNIAATGRFDFYSDPWLNAHHFLYQWARADENIGAGRDYVEVPERDSLDELSAMDRETWAAALSFYRTSVARLNHFNDDMLRQKINLLLVGGDIHATPDESIDGLIAVLQKAMPVYAKSWWDEHDASNRHWVNSFLPLLMKHEEQFVQLTGRIYGAQWPTTLRRIDVSAYANFRAGYTAMGHTVMYSTDPGVEGLYGLEMLLHEVQHTREVAGSGRKDLRTAFENAGMKTPPNLWHATIFGMAGAFVKRIADLEEFPPHLPYWEREGFAEFAGWTDAYSAINECWLPVVSGDQLAADGRTALVEFFAN